MSSSLLLQNCKLTYFRIPARGEATRLALTIGNIDFEDERITFPEWKDLKASTLWGSLPMLTLKNNDGSTIRIAQQRAILRLVGKETGLYPLDDHVRAAKVDSLMDALEDIQPKINAVGQGMEQSAKEAERKKAVMPGGVVYGMLQNVEDFLSSNGDGSCAVGNSLTIADLFVYAMTSSLVSGMFDGVPPDALDPFESIQACRKMVRSHPAVVKWYDELKYDVPASFGAL